MGWVSDVNPGSVGPVDRSAYAAENCSVGRALAVVGEKWTLLVLREAFYGVRRFDDLQAGLGCARNVLADRLRTLVEHGLLRREPYRVPGSRPRHEYRLTEKGLDLMPALVALMQWGDRWEGGAAGPPVVVTHRGCGEPVRAALTCSAGHSGLTARDTAPEPGPGAIRVSA